MNHRLENWLASWLDIICGLISVITFTLYRPWWDFTFRAWRSKVARIKNMRRKIKRRKK